MKTPVPDNKTMDLEPDSKESLNVDLDPEKTLDFALFQCANDQLMNPTESHESMSRLLHRMEVAWGSDGVKKLPPLDIIIFKDLVPPDLSRRIWGRVSSSRRAGRLCSASRRKVAAATRCGWWRGALAVFLHRQVLRRTRPPGCVCVDAGSCGDLVQRRCPQMVASWGTVAFFLDAGGAAGDCLGSVLPALLPWTSGNVLFEDYFNYLEEYFFKKIGEFSASLNLHAAASECITAENQLTTTLTRHAGSVTGHHDLHNISENITREAKQITDSNPDSRPIDLVRSVVQVACFRCIAEEAKLMSGLEQCFSTPDKSMAKLWQWKFEFSMKVRKAALDILTTYKGPYFRQVSASMMGMKKEATVACELLNIDDKDCEVKMHNSEEVRSGLLDLFYIIHNHLPPESPIKYYPIDSDYTAMASEQRWLRLLESSKISRSADVPFPFNSDENVKTPITPKSATSATSLRCSTSFSSDDDSGKDIKTSKRKSMIRTQDSETPIMELSERWKDDETTDPLDSQITTDGEPRSEIRSAAGGYPTNSSTATPLSCSATSVSAEESGNDNKKRKIMGGTKDSEMPTTESSEPWNTGSVRFANHR